MFQTTKQINQRIHMKMDDLGVPPWLRNPNHQTDIFRGQEYWSILRPVNDFFESMEIETASLEPELVHTVEKLMTNIDKSTNEIWKHGCVSGYGV